MNSNKVLSGVFWVYLERTFSQLIGFVVTIVLARLLEPSHYGTIALLSVFIVLAEVFVTSGISTALIQKKDADDLDYNTMFWFNLAVSLVLYAILFFSAPSIGNYYNDEDLSKVLRVLALSVPLSAFNCIQQAYVSSHMVFKKTFISNFGGGILSGIAGILMAYMGMGLWSLVVQRISNIALNTIFLKMIVEWKPRIMFSWNRLKPMLSFGWRIMTTSLMLNGYNQFRSLVIGKRYSSAELGFYDRGFRFPSLIASNIDTTITRVLFPALVQIQNEASSLAEKSRRAAKTSAYIMTPILWGMVVVAEPLVKLLLGEKWLPCVPYLQIMCFVWWLQPTQTCSAQAIKAIGRSDLYLHIEILSKIIGLLLLALAVFVFDSVLSIAITFLVGQIIAVFIYGFCSQKFVGYKVKHQLVDLLTPALLTTAMCLVVGGIRLVVSNDIICLSLQVLSGLLFYVLLSYVTKNDTFLYLKKFVIKKAKYYELPNKCCSTYKKQV